MHHPDVTLIDAEIETTVGGLGEETGSAHLSCTQYQGIFSRGHWRNRRDFVESLRIHWHRNDEFRIADDAAMRFFAAKGSTDLFWGMDLAIKALAGGSNLRGRFDRLDPHFFWHARTALFDDIGIGHRSGNCCQAVNEVEKTATNRRLTVFIWTSR